MFDLGILTIPALAASVVFFFAVFSGEEIVIDKVNVSHQLEWSGYDSSIATRQLTDELREVSVTASSELTGIEVDGSGLEKSVSAFEDYFELGLLVNGTRNLFGLIPYYINAEVTEDRGEATLTARVYTKDKENPVHLIVVKGDPDKITPMLHEGALEIIEKINPYIAALYYRKKELAAGDYEFTKTREILSGYLETRPVETHYLAYGLLGRMHMLKAEKDANLTAEQQEAEYDTAIKFLHAALRQEPSFLFPNINLAIIYTTRGEHDRADVHFADAVRVNPNYRLTRALWGETLVEQGRFIEAAHQYVAAVEIAPDDAKLRHSLAEVYMTLDRPDAARAQWLEALALDPTNEDYKSRLDRLPSVNANVPAKTAASVPEQTASSTY